MSAHNISFCGEIRKNLHGYPLLSGALVYIIYIYFFFIFKNRDK